MSASAPELRVLFADDKATTDAPHVERGLRQTLLKIAPHAELVWDQEDQRAAAIEKLETANHIDLVLIDAYWSSIFSGQEQNTASDMLRAARKRPETVAVLVSKDPQTLLDYVYSEEHRDLRPHAVLFKDQIEREKALSGVIDAAFGNALVPLRSRGLQFDWQTDENVTTAISDAAMIAIQELTCQAVPGATHFAMTPIGGGYSDSLTCLVETGNPASNIGSPNRNLLIKASQDPRVLQRELENHRCYVESFPAGTYARLAATPQGSYGAWNSLVFEQIRGRTLTNHASTHDAINRVQKLYGHELVQATIQNTRPSQYVPRQWMLSKDGLLPEARLERTRAALRDLAPLRPDLQNFDVESAFSDSQRLSCFGLNHGDLHGRNVLVRENSAMHLVDAASMRTNGLWSEDIARLTVWSTCDELVYCDPNEAPTPARLAAAFAYKASESKDESTHRIAGRLSETVRELQDAFARAFTEAKVDVNVPSDWNTAVLAELLRVAYSAGTNPLWVRAHAAACALEMTRGQVAEAES